MPHPEFKLVLDGGPGRWQVRSDSTVTGQCEPVDVSDAVLQLAIGEGAWLLKEKGSTQEDLARAGYRLFCRFFPGPIGESFHDAVRAARGTGPLRLVIQYRLNDPRIHAVPWELLFDRAPDRASGTFLALSPDVLLARYVLQGEKVRDLAVDGKLRVLHTSACPAHEPELDFAEELQVLDRIASVRADVVEVSAIKTVSGTVLRSAFAGKNWPPHVAIFSGHGTVLKNGEKPVYALLAEHNGTKELVTDRQLLDAVKGNSELRLVILNACESGNPLGAVPLLAEMNVPAVIGYRTNVYDAVAVKFARSLYEGILTKPIDVAVRDARLALANSSRPLDWTLPILFLRCHTEPSLRSGRSRDATRGVEEIPGHYDPRSAPPSQSRSPGRPTPPLLEIPPESAEIAPPPPPVVPPPNPAPQPGGNPQASVTQKGKLTITIGKGASVSGTITVNTAHGTTGTVDQEGEADIRVDEMANLANVDFSINEFVSATLASRYEELLAEIPARPID